MSSPDRQPRRRWHDYLLARARRSEQMAADDVSQIWEALQRHPGSEALERRLEAAQSRLRECSERATRLANAPRIERPGRMSS